MDELRHYVHQYLVCLSAPERARAGPALGRLLAVIGPSNGLTEKQIRLYLRHSGAGNGYELLERASAVWAFAAFLRANHLPAP